MQYNEKHKKLLMIIISLSIIISTWMHNAYAINLIRDTEIESALRAYTQPLLRVAHIPPENVHLFVLSNPEINAFVAGGNNIFINSGLLALTDHANEIIGVLAHEISHIYNHDLINGSTIVHNSITLSFLGILISLPLSIMMTSPIPFLAGTIIESSVNQNTYLAHMRVIEARADTTAVMLLKKIHYSPKGLLQFMKKLKKIEGKGPSVPFFQDHPLTQNRITYLEKAIKDSPYKNRVLPSVFNNTQARIRAKLIAYQNDQGSILQYYPLTNRSIPSLYAHTIMYMRSGKTDKALNTILILKKRRPNDPFIHELTGDILRQTGQFKHAIREYQKALHNVPWAVPILNRLAQTMLLLNKQESAIQNLQQALLIEPWNPETWKFLAIAYGMKKQFCLAYHANANFNFLTNHFQTALFFAKKAQNALPKNSVQYQQMSDLIKKIIRIQKILHAQKINHNYN